jgi:ligand-binding SRPBCC domain-containing protein
VNATLLATELWLPQPRSRVFPFFADARNLETLTPPWLNFEVLSPGPLEMKVGLKIDYRLRIHGIPIRWQSEISAWEPPFRFVDEQRRGPYSLWHHEHRFEERDGGTLCIDLVQYRAPGGPFRPLIERFFVRPDVEKIFAYRTRKMLELFPATGPDPAQVATRPTSSVSL